MKNIFLLLIFCNLSVIAQEKVISSSTSSAGKLPWVIGNLPENSTNFNYKVIEANQLI